MQFSNLFNFNQEKGKDAFKTLGLQDTWEKYASIRSRPRRMIHTEENNKKFYPISRQPLCVHPIIQAKGEQAIIFILAQSMYKFMNDIAILELEVVNQGALLVANNKLACHFSDDLRHDALSVIVDEAYHAYVAKDFMFQVSHYLNIPMLELPTETEVIHAYQVIKSQLPSSLHDTFQLIAVCIGEHVLTKELISISKEQAVNTTFTEVMADHVLDEGRHAGIFKEVLQVFWQALSETDKQQIGTLLPLFLKEYLKTDIQKSFDLAILQAMDLAANEVESIMADTYINSCQLGASLMANPIVINLVKMLQTCDVLSHPITHNAFKKHQFI